MKNSISPFDYVTRASDNQPKPMTRELFMTYLNDMNVFHLCDEISLHDDKTQGLKRALPGICWQAKFKGALRKDTNAIPSGFFCLDVDIHHEEEFLKLYKEKGPQKAYRWAENEALERASRWAKMQREEDADMSNLDLRIIGIHLSPSHMGVHVIACWHPSCKTIEENQARLASLLETSYDDVCKDWARIFFLSPAKDWTYLDLDTMFEDEED